MSSISFSKEKKKIQLWFTVCDVWMLSERDRLWQTMKTESTKNVYRKGERKNGRVLNSLVRRQILVFPRFDGTIKTEWVFWACNKVPQENIFHSI